MEQDLIFGYLKVDGNNIMPTIGIIDDRPDLRVTLKRSLDLELLDEWSSIDEDPLSKLEDYPSWLTENEVCVLLLDEKLHEQAPVDYNGHDVVDFLRKHLPTLPIFVITAYPENEDLLKSFKDVEGIIPRTKFSKDASEYVSRITRSAQRFLESFQSELTQLAEISERIAQGKAKKKDKENAEAIQNKISLAFPYEALESRSELLGELESKLKDLEKMRKDIGNYLEKVKKK